MSHPSNPSLVLAVADWSVEPDGVIEALLAHNRLQPSWFGLLVPARLAGLAWVGDPYASRPCATRQLATLEELSRAAGIAVGAAVVGDPEVVPAIKDVLLDWPAEEILIFDRDRRRPPALPLALAHRVERATGTPVVRIPVPAGSNGNPARSGLDWPLHPVRCI